MTKEQRIQNEIQYAEWKVLISLPGDRHMVYRTGRYLLTITEIVNDVYWGTITRVYKNGRAETIHQTMRIGNLDFAKNRLLRIILEKIYK